MILEQRVAGNRSCDPPSGRRRDNGATHPIRQGRVPIVITLLIGLSMVAAACGADQPSGTAAAATSDPGRGEASQPGEAAPQEGGILTVAVKERPTSLDPHLHVLTVDRMIAPLISDALVFSDENLRPTPGLAESWEQVDDTTWVFNLREGVNFHDGTPFDAEAVKFNIDRVLDPETNASRRNLLETIESTEVVDKYTVRIRLSRPNPALLNALGYGVAHMNSPTAVKAAGDDYRLHPVGTGPFVFEEYAPEDHLTLTANEDYWKGAPLLDGVELRFVQDEASRTAQLLAGDVDMVDSIAPADVGRVETDDSLILERVPIASTTYLSMNTEVEPFDDVRVRQAINYAIDVDAIVENVYLGAAILQRTPLAPTIYGADPSLEGFYEYDPDRARQLLADAGFADGFDTELWFGTGQYVAIQQVSEAIQGYLGDVGISVELVEVDPQAVRDATRTDPHSEVPMNIENRGAATGDPDDKFRGSFTTSAIPPNGRNTSRYTNPEFDRLIDESGVESDVDERLALLVEAQKILLEDAPVVWLNQVIEHRAWSASVHDVVNAADYRLFLHEAWISE